MIIRYEFETEPDVDFNGDEIELRKWALRQLKKILVEADIYDTDFDVDFNNEELYQNPVAAINY